MMAESRDGKRRKSVRVSAKIRPMLGTKSAAAGALNVGAGAPDGAATGSGASVCAELSQGMSVIPVHSVIVIKKAYAGCLMNRDHRQQVSRLRQGYGAAGYVTEVLLLDDELAISVETDGLPLRTRAAERKRHGVGPGWIVRMDRTDADSEECGIE